MLFPLLCLNLCKNYNMEVFSDMQQVKRHFFALRNGIIADTIRKAGYNYKIIFGLNIPQLKEIAENLGKNLDLALKLRENVSTRESLLLAPMIYPVDSLTYDDAILWAKSCPTTEVADVLCHSLLKFSPYSAKLSEEMIISDNSMHKYLGMRLLLNISAQISDSIKSVCRSELENATSLRFIANQVLLDKDFE